MTTRWRAAGHAGRHHRRQQAVLFAGRRSVAQAPRAQGRSRPKRRRGAPQSADGSCPSPSASRIVYPFIVLATSRLRRRAQMGRQFRHPDPHLRDARLGAEHRRRPRRPARPRLRRLLRGRRLLLRAARQGLRLLVLDPAAARRLPRRVLGRPARLSGAAPARRLSRHRHARLRRDHPPRPDQLGRRSPTAMPASAASRGRASSASRSTPTTTASPPSSSCRSRRSTARSSSTT